MGECECTYAIIPISTVDKQVMYDGRNVLFGNSQQLLHSSSATVEK